MISKMAGAVVVGVVVLGLGCGTQPESGASRVRSSNGLISTGCTCAAGDTCMKAFDFNGTNDSATFRLDANYTGCTGVLVKAWGGGGNTSVPTASTTAGTAGGGGYAEGLVPLTGSEELYLHVAHDSVHNASKVWTAHFAELLLTAGGGGSNGPVAVFSGSESRPGNAGAGGGEAAQDGTMATLGTSSWMTSLFGGAGGTQTDGGRGGGGTTTAPYPSYVNPGGDGQAPPAGGMGGGGGDPSCCSGGMGYSGGGGGASSLPGPINGAAGGGAGFVAQALKDTGLYRNVTGSFQSAGNPGDPDRTRTAACPPGQTEPGCFLAGQGGVPLAGQNQGVPGRIVIRWGDVPAPPTDSEGPPSNLQAQLQGAVVTLTWQDNSTSETGFFIERMDNGSGTWVPAQPSTVGANVTTSTDLVTAPGNYVYRVSALGISGYSNETYVTVYASVLAPPVPVGPHGCLTTSRPTFSWNPVAGATSYYLTATRADILDFFLDNPSVTGTSYASPVNLVSGAPYRWSVRACNAMGCSAPSPSKYFTPFCSSTQAPFITSPQGCVSSLRPTITWDKVPGAASYKVAVYKVVDVTNDVLVYYVDVTGTSYTPPANLVAAQEYRVKVRADTSTASGPFSRHRYFTPLCSTTQKAGSVSPISPYGASWTQAPAFSWEPGSNTTDYTLKVRSTSTGVVWQNVYSHASSCTSTDCTVLAPMTYPAGGYTWQVYSTNAYGTSKSPSYSFTTQ